MARCAHILQSGRRCPNAVVPGTRFCALPGHDQPQPDPPAAPGGDTAAEPVGSAGEAPGDAGAPAAADEAAEAPAEAVAPAVADDGGANDE